MLRPFSLDTYAGETVAIVGVPSDAGSSYLRGAAEAPTAIREALWCESSNAFTESGIDLASPGRLFDAGDLGTDFDDVHEGIAAILATGARVLALGGDHAVTHPIVVAHRAHHPRLTILHLDAHSDLYEEFEGNPHSHASPFARILEAGLCDRLVQVGIRTQTDHLRAQVERFGVEVVEMREWGRFAGVELDGPVYLSVDLDVLDPAFAPGVSHWEPGGASTRQVLDLVASVEAPIVGADVVELNPSRDPSGMTAMVAARIAREVAGRMIEGAR